MSVIFDCGKKGIGSTKKETARQKFFEEIRKLTESEKKRLNKELLKEQHKVNLKDFYKLSNNNLSKAKKLLRKATIEGKKRAYKKFGIDYKEILYPLQRTKRKK